MPTTDLPLRTANRGYYVQLQETPDGNLHIVLNARGREEFDEIASVRKQYGIRAALAVLLEDHLMNGWELVPPRDLGALTAAPILSREIERDLHGTVIAAGRVFWYPDYAVLDEIEELRRHGFLEFRGAV